MILRKYTRNLICWAVLAICAAGSAQAAPGRGGGMAGAERFDQMDTNKDNKVVLEEFRAAFPNMNEKAFEVIDINGDKAIDRTEWLEFSAGHARGAMPQGMRERGAPMNNIPGDPIIPPPDSSDLPLMQPPN